MLAKKGQGDAFGREMFRAGAADANHTATENTLNLAALVLHDKFGFGGERLRRFARAMSETAECVNQKLLSMDDVKTEVEALYGARLRACK